MIATQIRGENVTYASFLFGSNLTPSLIICILLAIINVISWLMSTRIKFYQKKAMRVITFYVTLFSIIGSLAAYGMGQARLRIIPFFEERLNNVIETSGFFESIVFEQTNGFFLMVLTLPIILLGFIALFLLGKYIQHDQELNKAFFEFQWAGKWQQKLSKLENKEMWPDLELGLNSKTKEMVTIPGRDRTLNTSIVGSIGTGKTAALGLPTLKMDLDHVTSFINDYPSIYQREDFHTEEVEGRYMSGISVIEPSNDLCMKTFQLVKAHGIPDEAITYINPLDPDSPSINAMRGPVDKVAEVFALVIAGLNDSKDGGNFFFEQAQRNHLKHYIYLLKLHDEEKDVELDDLLKMYDNPQIVHEMHKKLRKRIPKDINVYENRDERNYWNIVKGIDDWFTQNLLPKQNRQGIAERNADGEILYYDAIEEHVRGLRNILNDIGANILLRRVLFGKSDFDFDLHMSVGGVLLVNTAKGELGNLHRVLGKIVLMNLQNASFRRPPMVSSFHHILVDEAPDYLYNAFKGFPAQSRKYKVIITLLYQTIAQLAEQFGEYYMTTIIGTMRNRMVYGDVPSYDAKYFSEMFGEKYVYSEGQSEMSVSPLQENPVSRSGSSYSKTKEQAMSTGDIIDQEAFQCAVKVVVNNKPMPVVQINANFVPKEEFLESKHKVNPDSLDVWIEQRRLFLEKGKEVQSTENKESQIKSIEETEVLQVEDYIVEQNNTFAIEQSLERAITFKAEPHPRDPVIYTAAEPQPVITITKNDNVVSPEKERDLEDWQTALKTPISKVENSNQNDELIDIGVVEKQKESESKESPYKQSDMSPEQQKGLIDTIFEEM